MFHEGLTMSVIVKRLMGKFRVIDGSKIAKNAEGKAYDKGGFDEEAPAKRLAIAIKASRARHAKA
jgi:hypothetical protein